jgi:hypothetical protein
LHSPKTKIGKRANTERVALRQHYRLEALPKPIKIAEKKRVAAGKPSREPTAKEHSMGRFGLGLQPNSPTKCLSHVLFTAGNLKSGVSNDET